MADFEISQLTELTSPANGDWVVVVDTADTTTAPAGPAGSNKKVKISNLMTLAPTGGGGGGSGVAGWKNFVSDYGADNTGSTAVTSALSAMASAAVAAQPAPFGVMVPPGIYKVAASQDLPYNLIFQGAGGTGGDVTGQYIGSVFEVASSFSGTYVFGFKDTGHVSGATGNNAAIVSGIMLAGAAYSATAVDGFYIYGPTMCKFDNIRIAQMSGWAINASGKDTSQAQQSPFGQAWTNVSADSCGVVSGGGFNLVGCEDSTFVGVYSIGNNSGPGFYINGCDNTKFISCNSEWNATYGFYITGDWQWYNGGCTFTGCSTDANSNHGVYIDATWTTGGGAGTGPGIIHFVNLHCRRDGQGNTTTAAGICLGATTLPVIINGFSTLPNIGDGGTGSLAPPFGLLFTQSTYSQPIGIFNGLAWGATACYKTGSTNSTLPTLTTGATANIMKAHGAAYTPTYGS